MTGRQGRLAMALGLVLTLTGTASGQDRVRLEFENGAVMSGYNDVGIPGKGGTRFSLTDDLESPTTYYWRLRAEVRLGTRHVVSALAAPLRIDASGRFDRPVTFMDVQFPAGVPVNGRYVFNSYRLSYRYEVVQNDRWRVGVGVTGKIRDAVTRLESPGLFAEKTNVGFVPLVNFSIERRLTDRVTFRLAGDALAAPQGRAEDVFAGFSIAAGRNLDITAGYRLLEGGADNDEVYAFAGIHYAAVGLALRF